VAVHTWPLRYSLARVLDSSIDAECKTLTDASGHFELPGAPLLACGRLVATRDGYRAAIRPLPASSDLQLRLVLEPDVKTETMLRGLVLDAQANPVEGAWVTRGGDAVKSDARGEFLLDLAGGDQDQRGRTIRAVKLGWLPAEVGCSRNPEDPRSWPQPLVLVLSQPSLTITGRVVDAQGRGVPGAHVERLDRTEFGTIEETDGERSQRSRPEVEFLLGGGTYLACNEAGEFRFSGLVDRRYVLRAVDPATLAFLITEPIPAGTQSVEIRLPGEPAFERIAGHVVERSGEPVAGALVCLRRLVPAGAGAAREVFAYGASITTGPDGRFEFRSVSRWVHSLSVRRDWLKQPVEIELASAPDVTDLNVALPALTHIKVDLEGTPVAADQFAVLDAEDHELTFLFATENGSYSVRRQVLVDGKSKAVEVADTARTVVLFREGEEVLRIPLTLEPGTLNIVRP
jgi:hypothetical protein